jgi:hypothetical protein
MSCNCISDTEKKLSAYYRDNHAAGDDATATFTNLAIVLSGSQYPLYTPVSVKDSGKGYTSAKGKVVSMFFTYCPFCGKKTQPTESENQ